MIYLFLAILCSASLGVVFKFFTRFSVNTLQAIVVNYLVCTIIGYAVFGSVIPSPGAWLQQPWFPFALGLGLIFIVGFFIAAKCVKYFGVALTAIMQKISLIITVLFAILVYDEAADMYKWIGLALAIAAIIFINYRPKRNKKVEKIMPILLLLPFVTFLSNGLIDTTFYYLKVSGINAASDGPFTTLLFMMAGLLGLLFYVPFAFIKKETIQMKNMLGGIALGIPNFYSIYGLLQALNMDYGGSVIFPIYNIGMILMATAFGILVFKESMRWYNTIGILLAVVAIYLITNGQV